MSTDNQTVSARNIFNKLWAKKFLFLKVWVITFILSAAYIVPQPRTYSASVLLAPEMASGDEMGGLSAIASSSTTRLVELVQWKDMVRRFKSVRIL